MVSIASTAQVRIAIIAMLKVIGVSKYANECGDTNKGVGIVVPSELRCDDGPSELGCDDGSVAVGKEVAAVRITALSVATVGKDLISGPSERRCDDGPIVVDEEVASVKAIALERGAALRNSLPREPSAPLPGRSK